MTLPDNSIGDDEVVVRTADRAIHVHDAETARAAAELVLPVIEDQLGEGDTAAATSSREEPADEDTECPHCGRGDFLNERGLKVHIGRMHKDDDEAEPRPVDPPEADGFDETDGIDTAAIEPVDVSAFGFPFTAGNLAAEIASADGIYDLSQRLEVSRPDAEDLCQRLGLDGRIDNGEGVDEAEVRERLEIATEQVVADGGAVTAEAPTRTDLAEARVGPPVEEIGGVWELIERMAECDTVEDWSFLLNDYLQWGNNTKVHKSVAVFNMNAATDCVNRWTERCQVDGDECYAVVDEKRYDYVLDYMRRQEYLWDCLDADTWADAFLAIVERKRTPVNGVKFSQAGDFRHDSDVIKVERIAARLAEHGIPVFTYSASSHLDWSIAEHLTVNQSNSTREYGDRRYRVVESEAEIRDGELHCPFDFQKRRGVPQEDRRKCGQCRLCIDEDAPDVAVVQ